jgi:N-acetylmuramoyl-L-alanine amidase
VRDLQRRLSALGIEPVGLAGHFDAEARAALLEFQQRAGLHPDGVCDRHTWSALVEAGYRLGDRQLYARAPMMRGDDVADLQRRLSALGFHAGRVDGIFGSKTAEALADFQRNSGLTPDGIFGPDSLAALTRLGQGRTDAVPVAGVRERIQFAVRRMADARIALGEPGGLGALLSALAQQLRAGGAHVAVLDHPDWSVQAREANAFKADCYLGFQLCREPALKLAFFQSKGAESVGGRYLAETLAAQLLPPDQPGIQPVVQGMRLPVLRETRMPAVVVEFGPPTMAVHATAQLACRVTAVLDRWLAEPVPTAPLAAITAR